MICFLAAVSICWTATPQPPKFEPRLGYRYKSDDGATATQDFYGCCAIKAVEINETAFEMYALCPFDFSDYEMPDFCNSWCPYVKMSELKPLLEQKKKMMRQDDSSMMEEMLEDDQWAMMQLQMKIQRLQKYCFRDSEDVQAMCAEPDQWSELFQELWYGGGGFFLQVKGLK